MLGDSYITLLSCTKADERQTSSSKLPQESKEDLRATKTSGNNVGSDFDAAKVAAMRAAELGMRYFSWKFAYYWDIDIYLVFYWTPVVWRLILFNHLQKVNFIVVGLEVWLFIFIKPKCFLLISYFYLVIFPIKWFPQIICDPSF